MAAMVNCHMVAAPLTNTSNWLISLHSIRHKGFQLCHFLQRRIFIVSVRACCSGCTCSAGLCLLPPGGIVPSHNCGSILCFLSSGALALKAWCRSKLDRCRSLLKPVICLLHSAALQVNDGGGGGAWHVIWTKQSFWYSSVFSLKWEPSVWDIMPKKTNKWSLKSSSQPVKSRVMTYLFVLSSFWLLHTYFTANVRPELILWVLFSLTCWTHVSLSITCFTVWRQQQPESFILCEPQISATSQQLNALTDELPV